MDLAETVLLGAAAGLTIYIGLPLGRVERVGERTRVGLAMFSVGVLAFIFMDVTSHGQAIIDATLRSFRAGTASFTHVLGLFALLAAGFTAGTAGISTIERRLRSRVARGVRMGGGAAQATVAARTPAGSAVGEADAKRKALRTGMTIATAIGLHNFAEGLAIGVSARSGAISLVAVLIIGFGLHNATEGFGIVGPLGPVRPSWRWLALVGLIGGGPTFLGTILGYQVHSGPLELGFYALAGGAILYVVGEIWTGMRRYGHRTLGLYLLAAGFLVGVATDLIVSYGGG